MKTKPSDGEVRWLLQDLANFIKNVLTCKTNDEWLKGQELIDRTLEVRGRIP
jgi:hypothetical protein